MDIEERQRIVLLDDAIQRESIRSVLDEVGTRVEKQLEVNGSSLLTWERVPLTIYESELPPEVESSWMFVLRGDSSSGAERHPNSHQRMMSYRGSGDLQTWQGGMWHSHHLTSDPLAELDERWISIPTNIWHQAVVQGEHWVVVSFHTVPAETLIEERRDPVDPATLRQRLYLPEDG